MKEYDVDFEALKFLTRLAWQLDFAPMASANIPVEPIRTDADA